MQEKVCVFVCLFVCLFFCRMRYVFVCMGGGLGMRLAEHTTIIISLAHNTAFQFSKLNFGNSLLDMSKISLPREPSLLQTK